MKRHFTNQFFKIIMILFFILAVIVPIQAQWKESNKGLTNTNINALAVSPIGKNSSNIFAGTNGGGVFLSSDNGKNWVAVNNGLFNTQIQSLAIQDTNIFAGTTTDGLFVSSDNGTNWNQIALQGTIVYAVIPHPYSIGVIATAYAGWSDVWATTYFSGTSSWQAATLGLTIHTTLLSLATVPTNDPNITDLFVGTIGAGIYRDEPNWQQVNNGLDSANVYSLFAYKGNTGNYDLFAGTNNSVFITTDYGDNWKEVNSGLPTTGVWTFASSDTNLFIGTNNGVFLSTNEGLSWADVSSGLPNVGVFSLKVIPDGKGGQELIAGTSNGFWYRSLSEILPVDSWTDNFEADTVGTQPSNWIFDGNGTDKNTNYVDSSISYEGSNSMKLYGQVGGCWGAIAYHSIKLAPPFKIEVAVRNGNEVLSGCHPFRAYFGLRKGNSWMNPSRTFIDFKNGFIYAGDDKTILDSSSTLKWYDISVSYEKVGNDSVKLNYWIDGVFKGSTTQPAIADEDSLLNFEVAVNEGTAWFDNIKVEQYNPGWQDNFESDTAGTQPSNWIFDGNGTDNSNNYVDNTISYQSTNSLKLYGQVGGCWGALAYHPIELNTPIKIDFDVRNGNETLSGCHPFRASIGLREGYSWMNHSRLFVNFKNGKIYAGDDNTFLDNFNTLEWYHISVNYEITAQDSVKMSYWINGYYKGSIVQSVRTYEDSLLNFELSVNEGTAWFDNISVSQGNITGNITDVESGSHSVVQNYILFQNYPNPFNPSTNIQYDIPAESFVTLKIYDILGREVTTLVNEEKRSGSYEVTFNAANLASGVYFYRINAQSKVSNKSFVKTGKMILMK